MVVQLHSQPSLYTTPSSSTATPPHPVLIVLLSHWLPLKGLLLSVPDCKWPRNLLCKLTIIGVILCQVIFFLRDATAFDFFFYANDALIDAKYIFWQLNILFLYMWSTQYLRRFFFFTQWILNFMVFYVHVKFTVSVILQIYILLLQNMYVWYTMFNPLYVFFCTCEVHRICVERVCRIWREVNTCCSSTPIH